MSDDLPIIVVIALLTGVSLAALIWCVSPLMKRRFAADVRWLEHAVWQFTPEPYDGRRHVGIFYAGWVLALVAMLVLLPVWPVAFVFAAFLWWVPKLVIGMRWEKRRKKIDLQLSGAVLQMINSESGVTTLAMSVLALLTQLSLTVAIVAGAVRLAPTLAGNAGAGDVS